MERSERTARAWRCLSSTKAERFPGHRTRSYPPKDHGLTRTKATHFRPRPKVSSPNPGALRWPPLPKDTASSFQRWPDVQSIRNSRTGPERNQNRCGAISPVRRSVDSSLPLSRALFGRDFRESWFGTSMNWMELAPNTRPMPTIVVVAVEAAEMQYDSIETSEIS